MYRRSVNIIILSLILLSTVQLLAGSAQSAGEYRSISIAHAAGPSANPLRRRQSADSSPVMFIENVGQFADGARFQVRGGPGGTMWLAEDALWITLLEQPDKETRRQGDEEPFSPSPHLPISPSPQRGVHLKLTFHGANPHPRIEPFDRLDTVVSYFIGNDPEQWHPDVPVWAGVRYVDLYPGVDLELSSQSGRWTWRLVFRNPQSPIPNIQLRVDGADSLSLAGNSLHMTTAVGNFTLPLLRPVAADGIPLNLPAVRPEVNGTRITSPFSPPSLLQAHIRLSADYPLPQDNPDDLLYSTFLGGSSHDWAFGIAVDEAGSTYVTGRSSSSDFPTMAGAFDTSYNGGDFDAFVVKLNADGTRLDYATFLGGSGSDCDWYCAIAVDGSGNAYVAGQTDSPDFPTTAEAFDTSHNGNLDAFLVKMNADGTGLTYATFLGGSSEDRGYAIAVDGAGGAYVTGHTGSSNFPTTAGAFDTSHNGGLDVFVVKMNTVGTRLAYSTLLGGSDFDHGYAITVDGAGSAYVGGTTRSPNFPTTAGAFDTNYNGGSTDAFVAKLDPDGTGLTYATFLGGGSWDESWAIATDEASSVFVAGSTWSSDFPTTAKAFDTSYNGGRDAFVVKLNADGTGLDYATFLGGSGDDCGDSYCVLAVDGAGSAHVAGGTSSSDFPASVGAFDTAYNGGNQDAFVVKLTADGTELAYSTFLGGGSWDKGYAIGVDGAGSAYVTGRTESPNFPTTAGAFDTSYDDGGDVFVAKLAVGEVVRGPDIQVTPATVEVTLPEGRSTTVPLTVANDGDAALTFSIATQAGTAAAQGYQPATFPAQAVGRDGISPHNKVDPPLLDALNAAPDGPTTFFVYLKEQADLSPAYAIQDWQARGEFVYRTLRETAQHSQRDLLADLKAQQAAGTITDYQPFFILNAIAVTGGRSAVETLAARPDVAYLAPEPVFHIPEPIDEKDATTTPAGVEWNIHQIRADRVWNELGITGAGVVVANIDTGVDYTHPALVKQYRGTATGSHDFNWFDPTGKYPSAPGDNHGHGTHTMGIMVGDDGAGNQIGVAPGAQWIAAKGCAGNGCTGSDLLAAAQWILAPCPIGVQPGNPACDSAKRPQVVNNSWGGGGGDPWFQATVDAWRAAGIFPAFAAGNSGPGDGTVGSPGDYASSFASGASDSADAICWFSSRGPSRLTPETKPDVTTPGCRIRSALPGGSYGVKSGTSMASPHTAGVVALLLDANPNLTAEQIETLLASTALDLGVQGPDNTYGYGRVDAYSAVAKNDDPVSWLSVNPTSGTVSPGSQTQVTLTLNAAGLPNGVYHANLLISSNDPDQPTVTVPVTLTVTAGFPKIAHVQVSNLRDVSAAVSWITTLPADGRVYYGTNPATLTSVAHDDRGAGTVDDVHHVTIGGLNPNTTYYFYVVSGEAYDDNDGEYYHFTTGAPLSVPGSDSVYGQVFKSDGVTLAADVLVYLRVLNNDDQGSPGQSGLLSGLTDSNGYWIDSKTGGAVNLAAARAEDGRNYFVYSAGGDAVRIEIQGASDCEGLTQVDTANDSPAPDINLSCLNMINLDITTGWDTFVWSAVPAEDYEASDLLGAIADANGDAPEISQWVPEVGNWSGHLRGLPFNDFEVVPGEPYFMRANRRSLLQLPAGIGIVQSDAITLTTGWNFVALPRTAGVMMAEGACQQIAGQGGAVEETVRWDANVGNWAAHVCGLPFGDFEVTPDEGYFIKSQANSTWRPEGSSKQTMDDGRWTVDGQRPTARASRITHHASTVEIRNVQTTNVTDRSFTVLWETDQPASGQVRFGSSPATLDGVAFDDRGTDVADRTHHVTVAGLAPETTYYFAVESGDTTDDNASSVGRRSLTEPGGGQETLPNMAAVDDNDGQLYQVTTGPTLGIPAVQSVYGRVLRPDGETPAAGVLVQLVLRDGDGEGSPGQSAPLSAVTDTQGWWSVNLGAARTLAGDAYFATTDDDRLSITAWHPALGDAGTAVTLGDLPAALPLEMTVARERVYLPLTRR